MTPAHRFANQVNRTNILVWVFFLLEFAYICRLCLIFRPHIEGGLIPQGADYIVHGGAIYRDFFTIVWPGSFLLLAVPYALFGSTWLVTRLTLACTIFGGCILSYSIANLQYRHWSALIPPAVLGFVALPSWTINYYHWDGLFFMLCFVYALGRLARHEHQSIFWTIAAAVLAGAAVSCYQPLIVAALGGIVVEAFFHWFQHHKVLTSLKFLLLLLLPFLLVIAANFIYAVIFGALEQFISFTLLFPLHDYSGINKVPYGASNFFVGLQMPKAALPTYLLWFFLLLSASPWLLVLITPLIALLGVSGILFGSRQNWSAALERNQMPLLWFVVGWLSWMVALHRPEIQRLFWGSFVLLIFAIYALRQLDGVIGGRLALKLFYAVIVAGIVFYASSFQVLLTSPTVTLHTRRGNIAALQDLPILRGLQAVTKPGDKVLIYPYDTTINFLTQTRFPSIHPWLQYHYNSPDDMLGSIADMEKSRVKYVVWDTEYNNNTFAQLGWPGYTPLPANELIMEKYIRQNFVLLKQYGKFRLMVRK